MKRSIYPALAAICFLFLAACPRSQSQELAQKQASLPQWMSLREGVQVLKLWDTIGPKWPQIVLLQVSKKEYEMFLKDPKDYVNDLKVLGDSSTHKVTMCQRAAVKPDGPANTTYLLILKHERDTTTVASSSSNVEF